MPDVARRVVGRYEILRELGRDDVSTVHLARRTDLDRCVALRELHATRTWDPGRRRARSRTRTSSTVFDCFEHDGTRYVAMEYLERGSLRPYIGRMTLAQIGGVLEGLLAALQHAEARGIAHGDLKPENVLVTADGRVKIAGFGIARRSAGCDGHVLRRLHRLRAAARAEASAAALGLDRAVARGRTSAPATRGRRSRRSSLRLCGPLWRREAALVEPAVTDRLARPCAHAAAGRSRRSPPASPR